MKHIKKKFLFEFNSNEVNLENKNLECIEVYSDFSHEILSNKKGTTTHIQTDKGLIYTGFIHKIEGKNLVFPIPDPTLVYFHQAYLNLKLIRTTERDLIKQLDLSNSMKESSIIELYNFYGVTSGFVIYLFTALESFINQLIPEDYIYKNELKSKTEIYNKFQVQEYISFSEKIKNVITQITNKDFFNNTEDSNRIIWNLKEFRDNIVHTKQTDTPLKYDKLIKTFISFKYNHAINAVANFMNFYKPNYIEECDCGEDF